jgi:hypothetical protein
MLRWQFGADTSPFRRGLNDMKSQTNALAGSLKGKIFAALGFTAIIAGFRRVFVEMDRVHKLGLRFNETAETIQKVGHVSEISGSNIEQVAKAMQTATRNAMEAENGLKSYAEAFDALGINTAEFINMPMEDKILTLSKALEQVEGDGEKVALIMKTMGGRATELLPLLRMGSDELSDLFKEAPAASQRAVNSIATLNDAWTRLTTEIKVQMAELVPFLRDAWNYIAFAMVSWFETTKTVFDGVVDLATNTAELLVSALALDLDGAKKAMTDYKDIAVTTLEEIGEAVAKNEKHLAEQLAKNRAKPDKAGGGGAAGPALDEDAHAKSDKQANERKRLLDEIARKQEEAVMRQVDLEMQLVLLMEKKKALLNDISGTENDQLRRRSQALDVERQIEGVRNNLQKAEDEEVQAKAEKKRQQQEELREHSQSLIDEKKSELEGLDASPRLKASDLAAVGGGGLAALTDTTAIQQRQADIQSEILHLLETMPQIQDTTQEPSA